MSNVFSTRPVTNDDLELLLNWRNHPEVRAYMLDEHEIQHHEHLSWWENTKDNPERRILLVMQNEKPVAVLNFYQIKRDSTWWGFYLDNSGLSNTSEKLNVWMATERVAVNYARDVLQVGDIYCETLADNEPVLKLHQHHGFEEFQPLQDQGSTTEKMVVYMKKKLPKPIQPIFFLGSCNLEGLTASYNRALLTYPRLFQKAKQLPFGQYQSLIFDSSSQLRQQRNGCYVFCERFEDLLSNPFALPDQSLIEIFKSRFNDYLQIIESARNLLDGDMVIAELEPMQDAPEPMFNSTTGSALKQLISECNQSIHQLAITSSDVSIFPYQKTLRQVGKCTAHPGKFWALGRLPWSHTFTEAFSNTLIGHQLSRKGLNTRVLVLDLDNTLWSGIIGDDGLEGIQLGGDYPGNIFLQLQLLFRAHKQQGILLTICSKNTDKIAWQAIAEHPAMQLKQEDFVTRRINWSRKSDNIRELAQELNLGLSSFCFIDDNPVERQEVRTELPEVYVPELPTDQAEWLAFLLKLPELACYSLTSADLKRAEQYKQRAELKNTERTSHSREDFLKSLDMKVYIQPYQASNKARALQLLQKTNQFNTTTRRETDQDIQQLITGGGEVWVIGHSDKYSTEPENIAVIILKPENEALIINSFVMSCRVMGRDLERKLISWSANHALSKGFKYLVGEIIKTERNQPVISLYENNGFTRLSDQQFRFPLEASDQLEALDDIFHLEWL